MTSPAFRGALRRRLSRDDDGFVLVYVLMVITIVTILVGTTLVSSSSSVLPSVQSAYDDAASAAAHGGVNAFVAYVDANCNSSDSSITSCTLPRNFSGTVPIYSSGKYTASYAWHAVKDPGNRYFRVTVTGTAVQNSMSATKTLVADVAGGASMDILDYGLVTGFESESPLTVLADNPDRYIAFPSDSIAKTTTVPLKSKCKSASFACIHWSGASPGTAAGKVAVCNATFSEKGGRATTQAPGAPNPYVDWTETTQGNGSPTTNYQPCQVAMGHYTALLAPANPADGAGGYYSNDAMLLSNSFPGGTGPTFDQPVTTGWRFDASAGGMCGTASGQNYRSFELTCAGYPINVGGSPNPNSKYPTVQYVSQGPAIPAGTPSIPTDGCVYNGPTRVVLNGDGTATVTSPQTTTAWISANAAARPPQCYPGAGASGMALQVVNLTSPVAIHVLEAANNGGSPTTPAIAHGSSGWNTTGQRVGDAPSTANSVFYMASGTAGSATGSTTTTVSATDAGYAPSTGTSPATGQDGAWTPQWTAYSTGTSCSTATPGTDLKFFNCKYPAGSYSDSYRALRAAVRAELAANGATYSSATALQSYLTKLLAPYNSADAANATPTNPDNTSFRWTASVVQDTGATDGCTPGAAQSTPTGSTPIAPPTSDHLFASTPGSTATTTSTNTVCLTAVITLQVGQSSGSKTAWSSPIPQLKFTETYGKATPTTTVTPAVSSFPDMADVTQYQMGDGGTFGSDGPGDLYVEGRSTQTLTLLADDDLVVTGSIRPTDATQGVVELVGRNNVRIFHPVSCVQPTDVSAANWTAAITATQPGFCPDDITGLYTGTVAARNRPDQQYANMAANPASLQIVGPVFALGNADLKMTCPQPPGGGGVCGGEFTVDNYNRGTGLGGDKSNPLVIGTVAMAHHAPVGEEWEIPDTNGQTSRPWSGYQLIIQYRNFKNVLDASAENKNLLHTIVTTSSMWHVVSASLGRGTS